MKLLSAWRNGNFDVEQDQEPEIYSTIHSYLEGPGISSHYVDSE